MRQGWVLLSAVLVAIGMAIGGWFIGHGFAQARLADRYVTVKGLAERNVQADLALWPFHFVATDDDLGRAQAVIERNIRTT